MYVEVLQGYVSPERLAHMWSVVHLGVRSRCLRLHVEGAVHVGAQQEKVDDAEWFAPCAFARQALRAASDRHAEA